MKKAILLAFLLTLGVFALACAPAAIEPAASSVALSQDDDDPTPTPESEEGEDESESDSEETSEEESDAASDEDAESSEDAADEESEADEDEDESSTEESEESDASSEEGDEEDGEEIVFINADEGGVVQITGLVTYTNPFFTAGTVQPLVILEDQAGFVDRDKTYIFPIESQVLGQVTSNFRQSPFSYSLLLPAEPRGGVRDVDNDGEEDAGIQVFAVAYWDNTYGDPYLEERDLGGGGWSTAYASTLTSTEIETEREIIGGKLVVFSPDDEQEFPINFGEDGLLFTEDDQDMVTLPQGYTVVDLDTEPFTFDRSRFQTIPLLEPESIALVDFSQESYADAFNLLVDELIESYAFTDIKGLDWEALREEFLPRFEAADEEESVLEYRRALQDFSWRIPDGHISMGVVIEDFRAAVEGGIGIGIRDVDDGRVIVNFLTEDGPAELAGIELGAEIVSIDGITATVAVDDAQPFSAPFSTEHVRRLQKLRYAIRFPASTDVEIGYINPSSSEFMTTTLTTVPEFASFNQSSQSAGRTGIELPVEFDILDSGYGYVDVTTFIDNSLLTIQLWERMIQTMNERQIPGLVIDMRQNGGGLGSLANSMAGYFFEESVVVGNTEIYDDRTGEFLLLPENERKSLVPPDRSLYYDGDVVVLVGPACASACEFFSFNMTIEDRAVIVGQYPSAGLGGSVRDLQMPEGITVRYTGGRAVGPDGTVHIEGIGVQPDVVVPVTEETLFTDEDVVLNTAVDLLIEGLPARDSASDEEGDADSEDAAELDFETDLVVGDVISASIGVAEVVSYSLFVEEGDIVSIYADAASQKDLDLKLRLLDPEGVLILENDDLNTKTLNSGLEDLEIPFDLVLIVEVSAVNEGGSGDYSLRVVKVNADPEEEADAEAPAGEDAAEEEAEEEAAPTIVEIAVEDGRFEILVAAVTAAGLAETLSGEGPFTVFAPTDEAFAALPEGTVEALLEDPEGALTDILLYHVVGGAVAADTVVTLESATTLGGEDVAISVVDGAVLLNDSVEVLITDIEGSNGIIHVIDAVLLPPSLTETDDESTEEGSDEDSGEEDSEESDG